MCFELNDGLITRYTYATRTDVYILQLDVDVQFVVRTLGNSFIVSPLGALYTKF